MMRSSFWVGVQILIAWLAITLTIGFMSWIIGATLRNQMVVQLEAQIEGSKQQLKTLEAQNVVLKEQAINSLNDRAYIHSEVEKNQKAAANWTQRFTEMQEALKRLEARK